MASWQCEAVQTCADVLFDSDTRFEISAAFTIDLSTTSFIRNSISNFSRLDMNGFLIIAFSLALPVLGQDCKNTGECDSKVIYDGEERIVGGIVAADHSRPWMVYLYSNPPGFSCGGALIQPQWVLTTAHCVDDGLAYTAVAGTNIRCITVGNETEMAFGKEAEQRNVQKSYLRCWGNATLKNDIALLKLDRPFTINKFIKPIPLANREYQPGERLEVSGWGRTSPVSTTKECKLRTVSLPVVSKQDCIKSFKPLYNSVLCAGYEFGEKGTCIGDSGSPLVDLTGQTVILVGIVSYGELYCDTYSVYSKVMFYAAWINETIKNSIQNYY